MSQKHSIEKLNIDIHGLASNSEFQAIANRLSSIVRLSLHSRIEKLLELYSIAGYHIVIHKIELDLGYINSRNLENSILVKLEKHLERFLINTKTEIQHRISNQNFHYTKSKTNSIANSTDNFELTIDHLSKDQDNLKVMEGSKRYLEAVLHYLEFGYIPRHLHIPQEDFQTLFSQLVLENQSIVLEYFGRKSDRVKTIALERLENQISEFSKSTQASNENTRQITTIFDRIEKDKLEILSKTIENLGSTKKNFTSNQKQQLLELLVVAFDNYNDIYKLSNYVDRLSSTEKEASQVTDIQEDLNVILNKIPLSSKKKRELKQITKTTETEQSRKFWFFKTDREKFMEKMKILLDSNDKKAFQKLLETNFVQSIATTYHIKPDRTLMLVRGLLTSILNTTTIEDSMSFLPAHINSVKELLNQLYTSSPSVIATSLRQLKKFENDNSKRIILLMELVKKVNKKHLNLILQSIVSYYPKLATTLNFINKHVPVIIAENNTENIQQIRTIYKNVPENMVSQIYLLSKYMDTSNEIGKEITSYISQSINTIKLSKKKEVEAFLKNQDSKIALMIKKQEIGERKYRKSKNIGDISVEVILDEIEILSKQRQNKAEKVAYEIQTFLRDKYIPTSSKILQPKPISKLIEEVSKVSIEKKTLLKWFNEADILTNLLLRKLSKADYITLLETVLPTNSYRKFITLHEKYHFIWKTGIDEQQIQLIFLDLMKWHQEITSQNIFGFFFDSLKKYKGWTKEFHKRRVIERFELHEERLLSDEKELIIKYIDSIKTLESAEMKDKRNKLSEGIPIKNAGLVLLWPFFKTLFQLTELVDKKGDFVNIQARERGTLLLQYLAVGSSVVEEPYLALNKIMTGYPLEETVANEITLTEKERDISDALLNNVIRQWPSFENSSINNLRGSFIIRDGILAYRNQQWILTVENKAYDLLLGKLPWGYGLIRLSWLPYMIKVEWN